MQLCDVTFSRAGSSSQGRRQKLCHAIINDRVCSSRSDRWSTASTQLSTGWGQCALGEISRISTLRCPISETGSKAVSGCKAVFNVACNLIVAWNLVGVLSLIWVSFRATTAYRRRDEQVTALEAQCGADPRGHRRRIRQPRQIISLGNSIR